MMKTVFDRLYVLLAVVAMVFSLVACGDDDYVTGLGTTIGGADCDTSATLPTRKQGKVVGAYYYHWSSRLPNPEMVTHIFYCFAEVYVENGVYKKFALSYDNTQFDKVVALKKINPDLKVLLSFSNSQENTDHVAEGGFSDLVATDDNRKRFAQDCLDFMRANNIDGIDLDWEFPGMTFGSLKFNPVTDVDNFTLLLRTMRETFGSGFLLTYAAAPYDMRKTSDGSGWRYNDLKASLPYVDWINVMTYDLSSSESGDLGFNSALNSPNSYWDCARMLASYKSASVPFSKMVLGIPFYARHSFDGSNPPTICNYCDLRTLGSGYNINNWSDVGSVPYVTLNGKFWGSYENPKSIAIKGEWIHGLDADGGMRGMMYWEAGNDDAQYTLSKAVWTAVMKDY